MAIEISDEPPASPLVDNASRAAAATPRSPYPGLTGLSAGALAAFSRGYLPDFLGMENLVVEPQRVGARVPVRRDLMAPHGYLHGGTLVSVADSLCGYGTIVNLPDDATGFVTIELKSNFLGTIRHGAMMCEATPAHIGRTTQIWDAVVTDESDNRTLSIFRCSQLILRDGR
jgi:1,4-dihydroxy-2-naphthoyl-CoA hydrolase